jgi:lipoic acid synthetase
MVTRDDLSDGGASHIVKTVEAIRKLCPGVGIELLISDLGGDWNALDEVIMTQPEVLNHNIETIPRLYPGVRPQADYSRSIELLKLSSAHVPPIVTKSGLMLGLGETREELIETIRDIRMAGCHLLTLGQYLAPSEKHHPVVRYVPPDEFAHFDTFARQIGFLGVASAPLVRSSYQAERLYKEAHACTGKSR